MQLLEDAHASIDAYTNAGEWRPGLVDLIVFDYLIDMYQSDKESDEPDYFWNDTPDHVMEFMIQTGQVFDIEYGAQELWESLRDWLQEADFITTTDELEEEEEE
jgi:hypothetical protein